jgi:hypothetical protein
MVYACPSHNIRLALRRLTAARGPQKRSRAAPFVRFCSTTVLRLLEHFVFLYRKRKTVANLFTLCASLQKMFKILFEKY